MAENDGRGTGGEEKPFSAEVLTQFRKLQEATSKEDRRRAILALAAAAERDHDVSDETATDDYHIYFAAYVKAKLEFEQAGQRLGRLMADCIIKFQSDPMPAEDEPPVVVAKEMN